MGTEDRQIIGRHVVADMHGVAEEFLRDADFLRRVCLDAARKTFATVISDQFHSFGPTAGVTGLVLLAESHLSIHTWPELRFAAIDVFTCGGCVPEDAIPILTAALNPRTICQHVVYRGAGC